MPDLNKERSKSMKLVTLEVYDMNLGASVGGILNRNIIQDAAEAEGCGGRTSQSPHPQRTSSRKNE